MRSWVMRKWLAMVALMFSPWVVASEAPKLELKQVSDHAYYVEGLFELGTPLNQNFISNAGVVIAPEGVVVIDALGSPALAERLVVEIRKVTDKPIQYVIITHYHADHVYGLQVFKDLGAKVIAQEKGKLYLTSETAKLRLEVSREELAPWVDENTRLEAADVWVINDEQLMLSGWQFDLLKVGPAHTPDDLSVYVPAENVLFAGDLMFQGRIPFVGNADSAGWIKSLDRLLTLSPKVVVPGHGPHSTDPAEDLKFTRDYLQYLRDEMREPALNLDDFDEAYKNADWSPYEGYPLFRAANRMNAYNVFLSIQTSE
ncbi:MBL fold metallo-hydrolase [Orrella daihaiensis]|uniref:MBL fold metallo-hydrolase n=2 Tax=Orrella daihaiensis TaxID=2782176 RepID=A0ABY4AHA6_9BURK|nr:MBL fold metallo-hydrolase [Orrella daihaiensis]